MKQQILWVFRLLSALLLATTVTASAAPIPTLREIPRGKTISPEKAGQLLPYAFASQLAHTYKLSGTSKKSETIRKQMKQLNLGMVWGDHMPDRIKPLFTKNETQRFSDQWTGLQARAFFHNNTDKIILAFAGTDFDFSPYSPNTTWRSMNTITTAPWISYGYHAQVLTQAGEICRALKELPYVKEVTVTGNSLGGAIAQYAGLACGARTIAFNSLSLHESLRKQAAQEYADHYETQISPDPLQANYQELAISRADIQLELVEVEGEILNNEPLLSPVQGQHPESINIQIIPAYRDDMSPVDRHWAPAVVKSLEALSNR